MGPALLEDFSHCSCSTLSLQLVLHTWVGSLCSCSSQWQTALACYLWQKVFCNCHTLAPVLGRSCSPESQGLSFLSTLSLSQWPCSFSVSYSGHKKFKQNVIKVSEHFRRSFGHNYQRSSYVTLLVLGKTIN